MWAMQQSAQNLSIRGSWFKQVEYDLLIGADGAGSNVRKAISQVSEPGFLKRREHGTVYATGPCPAPTRTFPKHTFMTLHSIEVDIPRHQWYLTLPKSALKLIKSAYNPTAFKIILEVYKAIAACLEPHCRRHPLQCNSEIIHCFDACNSGCGCLRSRRLIILKAAMPLY